MHIAEVVTIAKSLPLLRLNTYKSLILSYSADYRRILAKKLLCARKKRKEESSNYKRKKQQWLLLHCCLFYLLNNLEADTQRMRMLIPIGTKQYELANLGCRTDMLADTWTNIIITDTNQTQGLARIIRQTV